MQKHYFVVKFVIYLFFFGTAVEVQSKRVRILILFRRLCVFISHGVETAVVETVRVETV